MNKLAGIYAGHECRLNGKRARITGRLLNFAIVGTIDGTLNAEWSWEAVYKIMQNGGEFKV